MTEEEYYEAVLTALGSILTVDQASSDYLENIRQTFLAYEDDLSNLKSGQASQLTDLNLITADLATINKNIQSLLERVLFGYYHSSGQLTGNGIIRTGLGYLGGAIVNTNGTSEARLTLYDNTIGSGTELYEIRVAGMDHQGGIFFGLCPIRFTIGCTRVFSGTGANCYIYYR